MFLCDEAVESAEGSRDCFDFKLGLEIGLQFALLKELLERVSTRQDPVTEFNGLFSASSDVNLGGDSQQMTTESPGALYRGRPLRSVFDYIDDIAEVDHVGFYPLGVRPMGWIPATAIDPFSCEPMQVLASAATKIEERDPGADEAIAQQAFDWAREVAAANGRLFSMYGGVFHRTLPVAPIMTCLFEKRGNLTKRMALFATW